MTLVQFTRSRICGKLGVRHLGASMRYSRVIGLSCLIGFCSAAIFGAQAAPDIAGPAELPPASYSNSQYVDSRGCVFVRAGIDGEVAWVPRVTRDRQQVCGKSPTFKTGSNTVAQVPKAAPRPVPAAVASSPQKPVIVLASGDLPPNTRIIERHIFENRENPADIRVPRGYRRVWQDDRLNPHRAERTLAPSVVPVRVVVPRGYRRSWDDDRLNSRRASGSVGGEAAMNGVWMQTLPRRAVPNTPARVVTLTEYEQRANAPFWIPRANGAAGDR